MKLRLVYSSLLIALLGSTVYYFSLTKIYQQELENIHSQPNVSTPKLFLAKLNKTLFKNRTPKLKDRWWKGNLHTHSYWSDGDHFPEMVMDWYKQHGYHFLSLSDHVGETKERWISLKTHREGKDAFNDYQKRFGSWWVELDQYDPPRVRIKNFDEYRYLFEEPDRFLIFQAEEISDHFDPFDIHIVATNLTRTIPAQGGKSVRDTLQNNINAVLKQRRKTGVPIISHIPHPIPGWNIGDLASLKGLNLLEIYNGGVNNDGDESHASTEELWDILLSLRWLRGEEPLFGMAVDDAHVYHQWGPKFTNPGRAWIMVKATSLTEDSILEAVEKGHFYSSTGVELDEINFKGKTLSVKIRPEGNTSYKIIFIGTTTEFLPLIERIQLNTDQPASPIREKGIGKILREVTGTDASYKMTGEDLYVRAKIISTEPKTNPKKKGEKKVAWTQPYFQAKK